MRKRNNLKNFDEKKWKPIIVGIIVFVIVFVGLTLYQQAAGKTQGDVILTDGNEAASEIGEEHESPDTETQDEYQNAEPSVIFVDVGGAVRVSGLFALPAGSRVADAIEAAGGLTEDAEVKYINRAFLLSDGDKLYIPTVSEVSGGTAPPTAGQVSESAYSGTAQENAGAALININTAGSEELQKLSGVGPVTAQKIIDYRTKKGSFSKIEDLMNVSGIGSKTFEKLRDLITV